MKSIKIIILLSLFFGFSSVYTQTSSTETKKRDLENKSEQTDQEIKTDQKVTALTAGEVMPKATRESEKPVITTTYKNPQGKTAGDQPNPSRSANQSKAVVPATQPMNKSKSQLTAGDKNPKKLN